MDHIESYFTGAAKKLFEKKVEKQVLCDVIFELTSVSIEKNNVAIKNNVAKIKIFGAKRNRVLSFSKEILQKLKDDHGIIVVSLD